MAKTAKKKAEKPATSTLGKAKASVAHAAESVATAVTHAAESVNEHVVHPVAEAVGIVKPATKAKSTQKSPVASPKVKAVAKSSPKGKGVPAKGGKPVKKKA